MRSLDQRPSNHAVNDIRRDWHLRVLLVAAGSVGVFLVEAGMETEGRVHIVEGTCKDAWAEEADQADRMLVGRTGVAACEDTVVPDQDEGAWPWEAALAEDRRDDTHPGESYHASACFAYAVAVSGACCQRISQ